MGIYGSITQTGMRTIFEKMCLDSDSVLLDVGAGLGRWAWCFKQAATSFHYHISRFHRPLLHALVGHNVRQAFGIELDQVKVSKANAFIKQSLQALQKRGISHPEHEGKVQITCCSVEAVGAAVTVACAPTALLLRSLMAPVIHRSLRRGSTAT